MSSIPLLFQILLSALLFYSSFVSIYINFIKKQFDFLSWFFSFSLCAFCLLLCYHIYCRIKTKLLKKDSFQKLLNKKTFSILFICLISLWIGFFNVQSQYPRGLQVSEIGQFSDSNNVMEYSRKQQQPPLDYYFSSFSRQLSESKFSIRFHTMLFYLLLCLALPLGLYYYSSFLISILGSLLFLINHVIRLHSVDARPLNLALLTGFLFLFFYISFYQSKGKPSLIPIFCSQYLFILSTGLQPVIFSITLFLSSFWLFFYSQKETFKKLFLSHIITAVLSFPFYFKMLTFAQSAKKFKEMSLPSITHYLSDWNLSQLIQKYFFSFYDKMFLSFWYPLVGGLLLIIIKQKTDKKTLLLLSSTVIFPLIFDVLFSVGIRYPSHSWYFIVFSLFLIFSFACIGHFLNNYLKQKQYYFYLLIPFLILFFGNAYLQILEIKNKSRFNYPYRDNSIERVYDYLKEKGNPQDFILELKLIPILSADFIDEIRLQQSLFHDPKTHPAFIQKIIQYTKEPPFFYENDSLQAYYNNKNNYKKNKNQKIFFISHRVIINREDFSYQVLSQLLPEQRIGRFVVFELSLSSKNKDQEYTRFLYKIKDKTPKKYQSPLLETLLYYSHKRNKRTKFNSLLNEYKEIKNHLPEYSKNSDLKYPVHFDHQRRIKYFETLNWN